MIQHPSFKCACCNIDKYTRGGAKLIPWISSRSDVYLVCKDCAEAIELAGYKTIFHYLKDEGLLDEANTKNRNTL